MVTAAGFEHKIFQLHWYTDKN